MEQQEAEQAAEEFAQGKADNQLEAIKEQQQVSERAEQLAALAEKRPEAAEAKAQGQPDALVEALEEAKQAAAE